MTPHEDRSQTQYRTLTFHVDATSAQDEAVPVVVSSDAVVEVSDGPEVLLHAADAIDLERAPLPIIATHRSGQINVGLVDGLHIEGGQLRGVARFGTRQEAAEYRADVLNRIIRSVSVGYKRLKSKFRSDGVLLTYSWMPTHVALVAEPADVRAGFYRERAEGRAPTAWLERDTAPPDPAPTVAPTVSPPAAKAAQTPKESDVDDTKQAAAGADADKTDTQQQRSLPAQPRQDNQRSMALDMERARKRGIENLCKANDIADGQRDYWINAGLSLEDVSDDLLKIIQERGERNPQSKAKLDLSANEQRSYSLVRALLAASENNWGNAGFELECSREISKRMNTVPDAKKFYVPFEVQARQLQVPEHLRRRAGMAGQRDLTVASASAGGYLVGTDNVSFIEMLRNRSVAYRMGAMRLGGLMGNVTVPKQTGAATWYWLASESTSITESQQTLGQMALSPKTGGAYTEISRQLLLQSSPDAEVMVTSDLGRVGGLGIDSAVLSGSGASGQPLGITNTGGIGSVSGSSLGFAGVLEFQTDIATANVLPERGGYATTPTVAALMMQRVKFSSTASPLWEGNLWDGNMVGFPAMSSNQMAAGTMLFGDWSSVVVAEWGVLEISVNPFANFQAGIIGVRAMVSMDCGLRYPAAFSLASSVT
jgi:HK97 family phage major capsid protein